MNVGHAGSGQEHSLSSSEIRRCHRHMPRERSQRPRGDVKASSTWLVCSTRSPRSSAHSTFLRSFMGFLRSFMGWFANGARLLCPYCFSWYFSRCFSRHTNISDESPRCHSPKPTCRSIHARQRVRQIKDRLPVAGTSVTRQARFRVGPVWSLTGYLL